MQYITTQIYNYEALHLERTQTPFMFLGEKEFHQTKHKDFGLLERFGFYGIPNLEHKKTCKTTQHKAIPYGSRKDKEKQKGHRNLSA